MYKPNLAPDTVVKTITIKDIELHTQRPRTLQLARHSRQFYVDFVVDGIVKSTECIKEINTSTLWKDSLHFDGGDCSVFLVRVYQKHHLRMSKLVGTLSYTISELLRKMKDDGVLEAILCTSSSNWTDRLAITIKFALVAELCCGDVNADEAITVRTLGPTPAVVDSLQTVWIILLQRIELFNKIVVNISQIHPYTSLALSVISAVTQVFIEQKNRDDRIVSLAGMMNDVLAFIEDVKPLNKILAHMKAVTLLTQQVTECGYFISEYTKQENFLIRVWEYSVSDIDTRIMHYESRLRELKTAFLDGLTVHSGITVIRMMDVVEHIAEAIDLNDIPYAFGARYALERGCLPGTRQSFLSEICDILNNVNDDAPRVCLLTGVAGSGKSAIAHSIARLYDGQRRLGSSYCFTRDDIARRNASNLFSTIARDLSDHDSQYKSALWEIVKDNRALRTSMSPFEQLEKLIIEPSQHLHFIGPLVIVIDALDESSDEDGRQQLLQAISKQISDDNFPTNLRFLITTRPESDIIAALPSGKRIIHKHIGDIPEQDINGDIERFIYHSLHQSTELESHWPNMEWCRLLVHRSQYHFQWASNACKFINGRHTAGLDPCERLHRLLQIGNTDGVESLDQLYRTVLTQLFVSEDARKRFQNVMAFVLTLKEPLSLASLSTLLGAELNIRAIIKPMGSLLNGVLNEEQPIRLLHSSFRDFLLDEARSSVFYVHILPQHSLWLMRASLSCMRDHLRPNFSDLKDFQGNNTDVRTRMNKTVPAYLSYSCKHWVDHLLQEVECTPCFLDEVTSFFKDFFPYWFETISRLSFSNEQSAILSSLEICSSLEEWAKGQDIATLAEEASKFIRMYAPILKDPIPHLHVPAMHHKPFGSLLFKLWIDHLRRCALVTPGRSITLPAEIHTTHEHKERFNSVACSFDGTHIVSRNATIGQFMADPLQGHTDDVGCASCSHDGRHVVSCTHNKTICV